MSKLLPRNTQKQIHKLFSIKIGMSGACENDLTQHIQFNNTLLDYFLMHLEV